MHNKLKTVKNYLLHSAGIKQLTLASFGDIVGSLLAGIAIILISRQTGPAAFGQFSAAFSLTLILIRFNDLGLSVATSKFIGGAETQTEKRTYFALISRFRLALSLLLLSLILLGVKPLTQLFKLDSANWVIIAGLASLATAYYEHLFFSLQALLLIKAASLANILQALGKISLAVVIIVFPDSLPILFIFALYMLMPFIPVLLSHLFLPAWLKLKNIFSSNLTQTSQRLKLFQFLPHAATSIISAGIVENVDLLFAASFLSNHQTGLLGGASRIATFLYILAYSVGNVLNPRVTKYKNPAHLKRYLFKAGLLLVLSLAAIGLVWPLASYLILYTIGPEYLEATRTLQLLLASGFITLGLMPFRAFFYLFKADWYFSLTGLLQVLITLAGGFWLTPRYGIIGLAGVRLATRIFLLIITFILSLSLIKKELSYKS